MFYKLIVGAVAAYTLYQFIFADKQDDRPPSRSQSHESSQPPVRRRDERHHWQNIDTFQRDYTPGPPSHSQSHESSQLPVRRRDEWQHRQNIDSSQRDYTPGLPSRSQPQESSQPPVRRCDERHHWQNIDTFQRDYTPGPPSPSQSHESSQPPVRQRDEWQHRQNIDSSQSDYTPGPPSRSQSQESSQSPVRRRDEWQHRQNIDSSERDHTPVEAYMSLRARAKQEGDLRDQCRQQSKEAYERHDHARAKALSDEGKRHARKMEDLNAKASAAIFKENNQDKAACKVDLHGLHVKEAIAYSKRAITDARRKGEHEIRLIVGQGNHSEGGVSRLKPAIQKGMQMRGHHVEIDPKNPGVLLVRLGGR